MFSDRNSVGADGRSLCYCREVISAEPCVRIVLNSYIQTDSVWTNILRFSRASAVQHGREEFRCKILMRCSPLRPPASEKTKDFLSFARRPESQEEILGFGFSYRIFQPIRRV